MGVGQSPFRRRKKTADCCVKDCPFKKPSAALLDAQSLDFVSGFFWCWHFLSAAVCDLIPDARPCYRIATTSNVGILIFEGQR